jgi:predicted outer membrane repeat protein
VKDDAVLDLAGAVSVGKVVGNNPTITVSEVPAAASRQVNGNEKYYTSIHEAVTDSNGASSTSQDTITVLTSREISETVTIPRGKHVRVVPKTGSTVTLTRASIFTGNLFVVENGGSLTLAGAGSDGSDKLVIDGGSIPNTAGALVYLSDGTFTMNAGVTLQNNKRTDSSGGGVCMVGGTFTMSGGTISGNEAGNGGGVYVADADSTFNMIGGTIGGSAANKNTATNGGGVYVASGTFILSGGAISGNYASSSSGNNCGGGVYVASGTFILLGGAISGNYAISSSGNNCGGGGVYVLDGTFILSGGDISSNNAINANSGDGNDRGGGGVYVSAGKFNMLSGTINENTASDGDGGGVYAIGGTLFMIGGTVGVNDAQSGGGVYVKAGEFTMSGGTIGGDTPDSGNKAYLDGGGVYIYDASFNMTGGFISYNENDNYGGNGGGIYMTQNSDFTFSGGEISYNTCTGSAGGIMVEARSVLTMSGNATIKGNESSGENTVGGGVRVSGGSSFTMSGGTISSNTAKGNGGGVYVDGSFTISGSAVVNQDNDVYLPAGRSITVGALTGSGPVAKITPENTDDDTPVLAGVDQNTFQRFTLWSSEYYTYLDGSDGKISKPKTLLLSSYSTLQDAVAAATGGTIDHPVTIVLTGNVTMASAADLITIGNNKHIKLVPDTATRTIKRGASGLYNLFTVQSGASLTLEGSDGNELIIDGGAVWNSGRPTNNTTKTALANDNTGLRSSAYRLIEVSGGTFTMENGVILQNNDSGTGSGSDGGAIRLTSGGSFYMKGGIIQYNAALGGGGVALRNSSSNTIVFSGGEIRYNVGQYGGGINVDAGSLSMSGQAKVTGNKTLVLYDSADWGRDNGGGGVFVQGAFTMSGGTIAGNSAHIYGGGVSVKGTFTKTGGTVYGSTGGSDANTAPTGAALYKHSGTVTIDGTPFTGTATDDTFWPPTGNG